MGNLCFSPLIENNRKECKIHGLVWFGFIKNNCVSDMVILKYYLNVVSTNILNRIKIVPTVY